MVGTAASYGRAVRRLLHVLATQPQCVAYADLMLPAPRVSRAFCGT